jgi:hypothetical protein
METGTCTECGAKLDSNIKGTVCPKCELRKSDWQDFTTHEYSRAELDGLPLGLHLVPLARVGALWILTVLILGSLGGLFGAMAGGDFGFGVGGFMGVFCGVGICKFTWKLPARDRYETLFTRRKGSFVAGAVIFGLIGGIMGLAIPASAKWTSDFGSGHGWSEAGVAGRAVPGFIGLAILGPIIGVMGAVVVTFFSESGNKKSYLDSFDEWRRNGSEKVSSQQ